VGWDGGAAHARATATTSRRRRAKRQRFQGELVGDHGKVVVAWPRATPIFFSKTLLFPWFKTRCHVPERRQSELEAALLLLPRHRPGLDPRVACQHLVTAMSTRTAPAHVQLWPMQDALARVSRIVRASCLHPVSFQWGERKNPTGSLYGCPVSCAHLPCYVWRFMCWMEIHVHTCIVSYRVSGCSCCTTSATSRNMAGEQKKTWASSLSLCGWFQSMVESTREMT